MAMSIIAATMRDRAPSFDPQAVASETIDHGLGHF